MTLRETVEWQVRLFEKKDLDDVVRINMRCLPEHYPHFFYLNLHERFPDVFLVARTAEDEIVGYIMCRVERGFSSFGFLRGLARKGHIISVAVLPEWRGRGLGSSLVLQVLELMRNSYGCSECFLEVRVSSESAVHLYERLGFVRVRRNSSYYRDGEEAYVMTMKLK